jgi:tetraacyldisaccharide-1-P 4'-kinase
MMARMTDACVYCVDDPVSFLAQYEQHHKLWITDDLWSRIRLWAEVWWTLDATRTIGNGRMLPWGPLRYPVKTMVEPIYAYSNDKTSASFQVVLRGFRHQATGRFIIPRSFPYKNITLVTGIAHPERVAAFLTDMGGYTVERVFFGDHEVWNEDVTKGRVCVVITEKDASRLTYTADNMYVIEVDYRPNDILINRISKALDAFF